MRADLGTTKSECQPFDFQGGGLPQFHNPADVEIENPACLAHARWKGSTSESIR
jgi:hypothetical protein